MAKIRGAPPPPFLPSPNSLLDLLNHGNATDLTAEFGTRPQSLKDSVRNVLLSFRKTLFSFLTVCGGAKRWRVVFRLMRRDFLPLFVGSNRLAPPPPTPDLEATVHVYGHMVMGS